MGEKKPADLGAERIRRRPPTDIGGIALANCLQQAVSEQRITPAEAEERLDAYTKAYAARINAPPDQPA